MDNTPGVQKHTIDEEDINETFCSVCLDDKNNMVIPYECQHSYCSDCIKQWNGPCPLCRSNFTNTNTNTNTNFTTISHESVNGFLQNNQKVPIQHHALYKRTWKKHECIVNSHSLSYLSPYGVVVICKDCNIIQCYNRLH
jgi:hypothetical protein